MRLTLSRWQLLHGSEEPVENPFNVHAGLLSASIVGPDLRYVRLGKTELVQRVYMAVRDTQWNTIPASYTNFKHRINENSFEVTFQASHQYQSIDFTWQGTIVGDPDGTISYQMVGRANRDIVCNKIGLNIHHPLGTYVGRHYRARTKSGEISGFLPVQIERQRVEQGRLSALFPEFDWLSVDFEDFSAIFEFDGDVFEMQDQRNWTDANFKTYGTPFSVPYPLTIKAGQQVYQRVTVKVRTQQVMKSDKTPVRIFIGPAIGRRIPEVGIRSTLQDGRLTDDEKVLLKMLRPSHIRCDVHLGDANWPTHLKNGKEVSNWLGARMELALFLPREYHSELQQLFHALRETKTSPARVFVFEDVAYKDSAVRITSSTVQEVEKHVRSLSSETDVASGSDFMVINRDRPGPDEFDGIVYPISPQVHACDSLSLMENTAGQRETVKTARSFYRKKIFLSPVTISNPRGPFPGGPATKGGLPPEVDTRQASLWGACWVLASLKSLLCSGADAITYFETTGYDGVMLAKSMPSDPRFPSVPGYVYPLYHVLADLGELKESELLLSCSDEPSNAEAIAFRNGGRMNILISNLTFEPVKIVLDGVPLASIKSVRRRVLDETTFFEAVSNPVSYRSNFISSPMSEIIELSSLSTVRLDLECL
jgi:hypothetical protein